MAQTISGGPLTEKLDQWLRIKALELQRIVTWSLTTFDERLRSGKGVRGTSNPDAAAFEQSWLQFKFWYVMVLMGGVSIVAPLAVLPRAPLFLGPICAFNAAMSVVLIANARRLT